MTGSASTRAGSLGLLTLPFPLSVYLLWLRLPRPHHSVVAALTTLLLTGSAVTNWAEWRMASARAGYMDEYSARLLCGELKPENDEEAVSAVGLDAQAFLRNRRLSVFEDETCMHPVLSDAKTNVE